MEKKMHSLLTNAKRLLPSDPVFLPILRGPFRGGRFYASPRVSLRKVLGLYESELNSWLNNVLDRVDFVFDVGANDGYFTFGCAAAMRKRGRPVKVIAFEPQPTHVQQLQRARTRSGYSEDEIKIVPKLVGKVEASNQVTLDTFAELRETSISPLIKIDVEGAELDVLEGATRWLTPDTLLLIEVHKFEYLDEIQHRLAASVGVLDREDQRPLPFLGRETRDTDNWWLVSHVS